MDFTYSGVVSLIGGVVWFNTCNRLRSILDILNYPRHPCYPRLLFSLFAFPLGVSASLRLCDKQQPG